LVNLYFFWFRASCVNKKLGKSIKYIHELVGELGYFLIVFQAVAALIHHYRQKDDTLTLMLPAKKIIAFRATFI
jgi:cytochrome b561